MSNNEKSTGRALHRAAQYIAAAGISCLQKEADDSHTTLTWDNSNSAMVGRPIPAANGIAFALNLPDFALECRSATGEVLDTLPLQGATHDDVVGWLKRMIGQQGGDPERYRFTFHYKLDLHEDRGPFPAPEKADLMRLVQLRKTAHQAMDAVLAVFSDKDPVRIWPHHFDSGALITLARGSDGAATSTIGIGLAIPDGMVPAHYLYVSPWKANGGAMPSKLPALTNGRWKQGEWNGALLEADGLPVDAARSFFQEATRALSA
ncbi:MAG: hypothetical protein K8H89_09775 [Flavobacteriales bacterium]|nr:hypothetical protein [Flavobacteriales bacterium]